MLRYKIKKKDVLKQVIHIKKKVFKYNKLRNNVMVLIKNIYTYNDYKMI